MSSNLVQYSFLFFDNFMTEGKDLKLKSNVKASPWLPQNDILGHPKTRLFIGHAGMNGMMEAGYHGVPMICVPFFGDQFDNAVAAKHLGLAEIVYKESITEENLAKAINTVLNNSRSVNSNPDTQKGLLSISNKITRCYLLESAMFGFVAT